MPINWKIKRILFLLILLVCFSPRLVKSQPIIGANQYVKLIKLVINGRIDIVDQILSGSKYHITKNVKEYELDNLLYKYDLRYECDSGQRWGDNDFYPSVSIACREWPGSYEEINIAFCTVSTCEILHYQFVELVNFINDYFGVSLTNPVYKVKCSALASMDEIPFPKFINSNVEIGSCSINQMQPVLETFSTLCFSLKFYKRINNN